MMPDDGGPDAGEPLLVGIVGGDERGAAEAPNGDD